MSVTGRPCVATWAAFPISCAAFRMLSSHSTMNQRRHSTHPPLTRQFSFLGHVEHGYLMGRHRPNSSSASQQLPASSAAAPSATRCSSRSIPSCEPVPRQHQRRHSHNRRVQRLRPYQPVEHCLHHEDPGAHQGHPLQYPPQCGVPFSL